MDKGLFSCLIYAFSLFPTMLLYLTHWVFKLWFGANYFGKIYDILKSAKN